MTAYYALALQTRCDAVNGCADRDAARVVMRASIARIGAEIRASKAFIGRDVRLVVMPEYFLTGFPMGESIAQWRDKATLAMDDPLYAELGHIARDQAVYLSGNAYETDPHFPELYFQTSFILDDSGALVLRYRRLISMYAPSPHDVWDRYLQIYGRDAVFPVADTTIGRLACIASEEILYPEIARAHAFRGAEVFCHSTSEVGSPLATPKSIAKRARAIENLAYVVSANSAGIVGAAIPAQSTDAMSCVVDYRGLTLSEAQAGASMVAYAELDLNALKRQRRRPGMGNLLARQRADLFAPSYAQAPFHAANGLLDPQTGAPRSADRAYFLQAQASVIERIERLGLI
jgi:predicted amidohydrolase